MSNGFDTSGVISPHVLAATSITAAKELPASIAIPIGPGKTIVTIRPDGSLEFGEGYTPDKAAAAFWEAVQRLQPTLDQRTGIKNVEARLRAGAFRDGADHIRNTEMPDAYMDDFASGAIWATRLLEDLARKADPK